VLSFTPRISGLYCDSPPKKVFLFTPKKNMCRHAPQKKLDETPNNAKLLSTPKEFWKYPKIILEIPKRILEIPQKE